MVLQVLAVLLCAPSSLSAQNIAPQAGPAAVSSVQQTAGPQQPGAPAPAAAPRQPDHSKEALVFDSISTNIREESDGTGTRQTTARVRILADAGVKEMAVLTFTYTALNQQVEIGYVRVIKPDGTVVATPPYNVQDLPADVTREAPMYSDIHEKHVAVKGLNVGDTLEYQVTLSTLKPEVPGHFWFEYSFQKDLIILNEQLDLDLPADRTVTVASADVQPTISSAAGRKLYHWSSSNLSRPDPDAPPKSKKHRKPSVQVTTFSSWEQVGAWYQSLQRDSLAVTPAIQAKASALTKGLTSDDDKLRAIFNDVALHIHYIGLEFGIGRYQPHPAEDVLSNEYGDCKDKHTLLASLLKAAGIDAWPVLISSGRELDPETPSPAQFDHVVTLVPLGGKLVWMDSTEEVAPVGMLSDALLDKKALAIPSSKQAYLENTPADLPSPRSILFQVDGKLSDKGVFTGHIVHNVDGDVGVLYRSVFRRIPQSKWKEALQNLAQYEGFSGEIANPQVSDVEQIGQPLNFSYDYTREKFNQWSDSDASHWISPALPSMGGELAPGVKEKRPADDIEQGATGKTVYRSTVVLPDSWSMVPPKDVDLKEDWLEYHARYSFKNGIFTTERTAVIKKTKVPLDQWEKYLAIRRGMFEDLNRQILISPPYDAIAQAIPMQMKIVGGNAANTAQLNETMSAMQPLRDVAAILETDPPPTPEDLAKAVELCRKTVDLFEARSLALPSDDERSLYFAESLGLAWTELGWAALESNDLPTAETYLRAAWRLTHEQMAGYQLARLLEKQGSKAAAAHQYELAHATSSGGGFGGFLFYSYNVAGRIPENYKKLTGKELTANALNHGEYNGSLRAELDKDTDIHGFTPTSKLTGEALFAVAYEEGKPAKANFLNGGKAFASMAATLQGNRFGVLLPAGSKAKLLREVRIICTPYGGCDAYLFLPSAVQIPPKDITPPNAPKGTKTIQIEVQP